MQVAGKHVKRKSSSHQTAMLNLDKLFDVSNVNNLLNIATKDDKYDQKVASALNQQLKDKMKLLLKTMLDKYTQYLTYTFQQSIQSQLKQVSEQQVMLMQILQKSIQQTLVRMHRPNHFNPSIVLPNGCQTPCIESGSKTASTNIENPNSINTRKLHEFRFRLTNASLDIDSLKKENLKLRKKVLDLTCKLRHERRQRSKSQNINEKENLNSLAIQPNNASFHGLSRSNDSINKKSQNTDQDSDSDSESLSDADCSSGSDSDGSEESEQSDHKKHIVQKRRKKRKVRKKIPFKSGFGEVWEYLNFCEKNPKHRIDTNRVKYLIKKCQKTVVQNKKADTNKFQDSNIKVSKLAAENFDLKKQLQEWDETIEAKNSLMQHNFDMMEIQLKSNVKVKIEAFKATTQGLETALESIEIGLTCPHCLSHLKNPILLSYCGHTVCQDCIETVKDSNAVICPECKETQTKNDHFIEYPILQDIVTRISSLQYHCEKMKAKAANIVNVTVY